MNPTQLTVLNHLMDYHLKGHPYVKTALDMACWDILGKVTGLPVNTLLGGNFNPEGIPLYRAISQGTPEAMAATVRKYKDQGYSRFQLKLGGDPDTDILRIKECRGQLEDRDILIGDSNTGWTSHQALRIALAIRDIDVYIEQPCPTYKECLIVRQHTDLPFVLDEVVNDLHSLLIAHQDGAADVVNIKISKFGGITKARQALELCSKLGLSEALLGGDDDASRDAFGDTELVPSVVDDDAALGKLASGLMAAPLSDPPEGTAEVDKTSAHDVADVLREMYGGRRAEHGGIAGELAARRKQLEKRQRDLLRERDRLAEHERARERHELPPASARGRAVRRIAIG